jgi:hypothetical protein
MDTKTISMVSGGAILALTSSAWAGPMPVASENVITPPMQTEQVHYYWRHHYYRHHAWYHHHGSYWHYGWYRSPHRYVYRHRWHRYYAWNPVGAAAATTVGLATLPFAWAAGGWPYYGYPGYAYRYPYRYPYYYY